ncbi:MAG: Gfo/Idh/MocA family protein [Candidatus Zipacnadales bacterium]
MSTRPRRNQISRRQFLSASTQAMLGTGAGLFVLSSRAKGANDRIVMGHIGVGGMGKTHVNWFASHADVDIAAICDVDKGRCEAALTKLREKRPDTRAEAYYDFRRVLERKDIDAISCATPDHWHALVTILAFQAGKDVYSEKPLSHNLREGQAMLKAGRRYKRVFQLGTQIHEGPNYHRVVELVRSGVLGKIHTVRLWKSGGAGDMGYPEVTEPPPELDYDMWLGPAPWRPYIPQRCHYNFRFFWDYSGGVYADFWCHIADIFFWAMDPGQPLTVEARGEVPPGIADTPAWIEVDYEFPGGLKVFWTTNPPNVPGAEGKGIGCQFEGTEGSLVCDYGSRIIFLGDQQMNDIPEVPQSIPRSPGHQRNFLDCVKSRALTESNLPYVRVMTIPMHLGCISFRLKRKLTWEAETEQFVDDEAANALLSRPYRAPWYLPI